MQSIYALVNFLGIFLTVELSEFVFVELKRMLAVSEWLIDYSWEQEFFVL